MASTEVYMCITFICCFYRIGLGQAMSCATNVRKSRHELHSI